MLSFDIAEEGDASHDPVVGRVTGAQYHGGDVIEVGTLGFLINGTHIELGVGWRGGVDG